MADTSIATCARRALQLIRQVVVLLVSLALVGAQSAVAAPTATGPTIVLIGGEKQGYPKAEHDYPDGVVTLARLIKGSPQLSAVNPVVKTFPAGFPADLSQIADADVVIFYFGLDTRPTGMSNPLDDTARRAAIERLMARGAGLIALHQAFTVADKASPIPMADWLGGVRIGLADRSTEYAPVQISGAKHPVARGLKAFAYYDEFYPTLSFSSTTKVTPVLTAKVHVQTRNNIDVFQEPAAPRVIAWAAERPDGGRSFGFTGGHYLAAFDEPELRTMLLNAILWTAKLDVPEAGASTTAQGMARYGRGRGGPPAPLEKVVLPYGQALIEPQPWGKLEWFASRALGNSTSITTGQATVSVGKANPVHRHPNCDEVLHVTQGHISHRVGDREYDMRAGDTVTIPEGTLHNARNVGAEDAIFAISFSCADRISIGEGP